jgi:hypothetical protein
LNALPKLGNGASARAGPGSSANNLSTQAKNAVASGGTRFAPFVYSNMSPATNNPMTTSYRVLIGVCAKIWPSKSRDGVTTACWRSVEGKMCGRALINNSMPVEGHAVNSSSQASPNGVTSTSRNRLDKAGCLLSRMTMKQT